jgi:hypothetical protein
MSFWDSIKPPKPKAPTATSLEQSADQKTISIGWSDGATHQVPARLLRQYCPCAECVEEWSGKRTYDVEQISGRHEGDRDRASRELRHHLHLRRHAPHRHLQLGAAARAVRQDTALTSVGCRPPMAWFGP